MQGTVKFFNSFRNFGFISNAEGGKDAYVHRDDILDGAELNEGDKVSFDLEQESRGPKAKNVKKL